MRLALIQKSRMQTGNSVVASILTFTLFIVSLFLICNHRSSHSKDIHEVPVGYIPGSKVVFREAANGLPEGTLAIVMLIREDHVALHVLNHPNRFLSSVRPDQIEDLIEIPMPNAPSRNSFDPQWPYWHLLRQDPWYSEQVCIGYLFCHDCDIGHHSVRSLQAFSRLRTNLFQPYYHTAFLYRNVSTHRHMQTEFIQYVTPLFAQDMNRLYWINIRQQHSFLIEQSGDDFRIYQSWRNGFSLEYWTDASINPNAMCEPGFHLNRQLLDWRSRDTMVGLGMTDDSDQIKIARTTYGCLNTLRRMDVMRLMMQLSHGFVLKDVREKFGPHSLPASHALNTLNTFNSNQFLGKSAISIAHLVNGEPFAIDVTFIEFLH